MKEHIITSIDTRHWRLQAGDSGVAVLRAGAGQASDSEGEDEAEGAGPPSPCRLRFVNDNVLINGRSSLLAARAARDPSRLSKVTPAELVKGATPCALLVVSRPARVSAEAAVRRLADPHLRVPLRDVAERGRAGARAAGRQHAPR